MSSGILSLTDAELSELGLVSLRDVPWDIYVALRDIEANNHVRMLYDRKGLVLSSLLVATRENPGLVRLEDIPWSLYVQLRDIEANNAVRMTYDRGILTIMSPSPIHERFSSLVSRLVAVWTEERNIPIVPCGATTFRREDMERGLEPDKCYYIQTEALVRPLRKFPDPPPAPDLAIEIDVTSLSDSKLSIYAALGVKEIWLWQKKRLLCLLWNGQRYVEVDQSAALPGFPLSMIPDLMEAQFTEGLTGLARRFRTIIQNIPS